MAAHEERIESLYQQASSEYLQGEFAAALAIWREMLELSPGDERALEGVRLCELLTRGDTSSAADPAPTAAGAAPLAASSAAAGVVGTAVADPAVDQRIEESLEVLDHLFPDTPAAQPVPTASTAPETPPAVETPGPAASILREPTREDLDDAPLFDLDVPEDPSPAAPDPAADELSRRVAELIADARRSLEARDLDGARGVLARVFILDETNAEALALAAQIDRAGDGGAGEAAVDTAAADDLFADPTPEEIAAASAVPETLEMSPPIVDTPPEVEPPAAESPTTPERVEPLDSGDVLDELAAAEAAADAAPPKVKTARRLSLPRWALPALVGVAVVGAAVYFGSGLLGLGAEPLAEAVPVAKPPAPAGAGAGDPVAAAAPSEPAESVAGPAAVDIPRLLTEARGRMESGDYQAAILTFNRVLEADPAQEQAIDGLTVAGELYRERKAVLEKWQDIDQLFAMEDYRGALTLLYRLPESEAGPRLRRYQRDGWYNLGVQALQASDCPRALEHLDEALAIDPGDRGVQQAIVLAERCQDDLSPRALSAAVDQLGPRKPAG